MADWLGHVPTRHEPDLRSRLQSKDDAQFESAFWELYLHVAYRRSGYKVLIHPPLAGTGCRPDFLVEGHGTRFYLEAVRACAPADEVRQNKLREDVRQWLATLGACSAALNGGMRDLQNLVTAALGEVVRAAIGVENCPAWLLRPNARNTPTPGRPSAASIRN